MIPDRNEECNRNQNCTVHVIICRRSALRSSPHNIYAFVASPTTHKGHYQRAPLMTRPQQAQQRLRNSNPEMPQIEMKYTQQKFTIWQEPNPALNLSEKNGKRLRARTLNKRASYSDQRAKWCRGLSRQEVRFQIKVCCKVPSCCQDQKRCEAGERQPERSSKLLR